MHDDATASGSVEIRRVSKHFEGAATPAVDDVSLTVRAGQFLTLLGPSGSGKTTTLMILAGFVKADSGDVVIDGEPMKGVPPHLRGIGVMFQHYALFPHKTVFENIAYPLKARRQSRTEIAARVSEALDLIQLPDVAKRYPRQLSGGQQQRVALARALVFRPKLLLMDEPLGALDRKLREQMQVELRSLQKRLGITTVSVTHDQEEAMALSDDVVVMRDGRIEQHGSAEELYERPANSFIADFLGSSNLLPGVLSGSDGNCKLLTSGGVSIPVRAPSSTPHGTVHLMLRPERLRLERHEALDVSLNARVEAAIYLGDRIRYHLALADGTPMVAMVPNRSDRPRHVVGDTAMVGWTHDDAIVL